MKIIGSSIVFKSLFMAYAFIFSLGVLDLAFMNPVSPWHDELWNLYPSLLFFGIESGAWAGCRDLMCLTVMSHQVPILSGFYHGVLKTLIFSPLVLAGNLELIRLFNILIYFLPFIYILKGKNEYGKSGAWILIFSYYVLFPNILFEALFDQGQIIIPNTLLSIAILELIRNYSDYFPNRLVITILLASLAIYEKLTNLPMGLAVSGAALLLLLQGRSYKHILFSLTGCFIIAIPYLLFFFRGGFANLTAMTEAPQYGYLGNIKVFFMSAYESIFAGSFTLGTLMNTPVTSLTSGLVLTIVILAWFGAVIFCVLPQKTRLFQRLLILSLPIQVLLIWPFFDGLLRPWHMYQMLPLIFIPFGFMVYTQKKESSLLTICIGFIFLIGISNLLTLEKGFLNKARSYPYDNSLFSVAKAISAKPSEKNIVCLDYSVCYNLSLLIGSNFKILAEWAFAPKQDICKNIESLKNRRFYLVSKVPPHTPKTKHEKFMYDRSLEFYDNCSHLLINQTDSLGLGNNLGYRVYSAEHFGN